MKMLKLTFLYIVTAVVSVTALGQNSNETLEIVYLSKDATQLPINDFDTFNRQISSDYQTSFREILKSVDKDNQLQLTDGDQKFSLSERAYIKTLRRSVNKSSSFIEFIENLQRKLPELEANLDSQNSLRNLYFSTKEQTINSKLAALPSVL